jgi:hypothetical protein
VHAGVTTAPNVGDRLVGHGNVPETYRPTISKVHNKCVFVIAGVVGQRDSG